MKTPKGPLQFFENLREWIFKNLKGPLSRVFGIVRFFKRNHFRFEIRFSQAQHAISDFCFFKGVFSMRLLKFVFTESPPQFLPETKHFASVKDSSRFSALCDLPETIKKISKKKFPPFSASQVFFKSSQVFAKHSFTSVSKVLPLCYM